MALQRQAIAAAFGSRTPVVQRVGHKPRIGDQIRYPSTGPKKGDVFSVTKVDDGGGMEVRDAKNKTRTDIKWTDEKVWLMYAADEKDVDMRVDNDAWAKLTPQKQAKIIEDAKAQALKKILEFASPGMINQTTRSKLKKEVTIDAFQKARAGEWQTAWSETEDGTGKSQAKARKWQFTIDMDKPLATSWQEPHVGWEIKLIDAGANGSGKPYEDFAKQQGHVWLNDVPEFRTN